MSKEPSTRGGAKLLSGVVTLEPVAALEGWSSELLSVHDNLREMVDKRFQEFGILHNTNECLQNSAIDSSSVGRQFTKHVTVEEKLSLDAQGAKEAILEAEAR